MNRLLSESAAIRDIHRVYQLIDGKCSALIGHVSLMIAATSFLYGNADPGWTKSAFLIEAGGYLLIAVLLLGTIGLSMYKFELPPNPEVLIASDVQALERYFGKSCRRRVRLYVIGHVMTIALTAAVIATGLGSLLIH